MNKSYKSIWNESLGAWVAISELTRSRSKRSRAGRAADVLRSAVVSVGALALGVGVAWGHATASSVALTGAADTSSAPVNGSLVYNTATANTGGDAVSPGLYVWSAGKWIRADTQFAQVNPNSAGVAGAAAQATGDQSIAVGTGAFAQGQQSVAIGDAAKATNQAGMAIGNLANSSGQAAMAIGLESKAASENSLAIGSQATAIGNADISVGANAGLGGLLTNNDNTSIGQSSGQFVSGRVNTAIGIDSGKNVTGDYNIALGPAAGSGITASRTVSVGTDATASKNYAIALGSRAQSSGVSATAVGTNSRAQGQQSIAVGEDAQATDLGGIAIGASALANNANDVALGSSSVTAAAVGTSNATVGTTTYGEFAGTAPLSTVSIGAVGAERTLTNVAAGRITAASTDAINGSQLFSVANTLSTSITDVAAAGVQYGKNPDGSINYSSVPLGGPVSKDGGLTGGTTISNVAQGAVNALSTDAVNGAQLNTTNTNLTALANSPLTFTGNSGTVQRKLGEELRITGTGTTPGAYSGANLKTEVVGNEVRIKMADAPTFTSVNTANLTVTNTANLNTLNVTGPATLSGGTTISNMLAVAPATVVNMGGNVITNVAAGTNQTDAVNVQQLQKMQGGGVQYAKNLDGSINQGSVVLGSGQAGGTMVSNVAPGVAGTDAVNVNQMNTGLSSVGKVINDLAQRIDGNEKNADAGTAGAMAMASMPQAFIPGKSMLGAGAATYQGQTAIAIGVSKLSENGKWVLKLNGAANSRGKVGVSVGAGFHW